MLDHMLKLQLKSLKRVLSEQKLHLQMKLADRRGSAPLHTTGFYGFLYCVTCAQAYNVYSRALTACDRQILRTSDQLGE